MPTFSAATLTRLIGAIEADRLVLLCGAGLSMPPPSNLMSAVRVSETCYDKWNVIQPLPPALKSDIALLAGHFHAQHQLQDVFIRTLVPWSELVGTSNDGHAALADFLITHAAAAALSANFDVLIEQWAQSRHVPMRGALTGQQAITAAGGPSPLLKFHGCFAQDIDNTLWTDAQMPEPIIAERIQSCSQWMQLNLPGKHILIIGFWTDWGYLNDILANAMSLAGAGSVTVVDPATAAQLQLKAPVLWGKLTAAGVPFEHVQASGNDALNELRLEFSRIWAKRFYRLGKAMIEAEGHVFPPALDNPPLDLAELYALRQDAEGMPRDRAPKMKAPRVEAELTAYAHLLLWLAHATPVGSSFVHAGSTIRVVHGGGQSLESVKERFKEPPSIKAPDVVICAGSRSFNTPSKLIATGTGASIVRPATGGASRWLTLEEARAEFAL